MADAPSLGYRITACLPGREECDLGVTPPPDARKTAFEEADKLLGYAKRLPRGRDVEIRIYSCTTGELVRRIGRREGG